VNASLLPSGDSPQTSERSFTEDGKIDADTQGRPEPETKNEPETFGSLIKVFRIFVRILIEFLQ